MPRPHTASGLLATSRIVMPSRVRLTTDYSARATALPATDAKTRCREQAIRPLSANPQVNQGAPACRARRCRRPGCTLHRRRAPAPAPQETAAGQTARCSGPERERWQSPLGGRPWRPKRERRPKAPFMRSTQRDDYKVFRLRIRPRPARPSPSIAQVEGSGTLVTPVTETSSSPKSYP